MHKFGHLIVRTSRIQLCTYRIFISHSFLKCNQFCFLYSYFIFCLFTATYPSFKFYLRFFSLSLHHSTLSVLPHSVSIPDLFPTAISAFPYFLFLLFSFCSFHSSSFPLFSLLSSPLTFNFCFPFSISLFLHFSFPFFRSNQPLTQMSTWNISRAVKMADAYS